MTEKNIVHRIMLSLSKRNTRVFKNVVGLLYTKDGRPQRIGLCTGSSDLIGWTSITITPDMVGKRVAVYTAIEVKQSGGKASAAQLNFLRVVLEAGGYAGIARCEEDAEKICYS